MDMSAMQCSSSRFCELDCDASSVHYVSLTYAEVGGAVAVLVAATALASWGLGRHAEALWGAIMRFFNASRALLQANEASSAGKLSNTATVS
jgi:hypothetical protein